MRIEDVMSRHVFAVASAATVLQAAQLMAENSVGSVVVIKGHRLVGLITDRDLVTRVLAKGRDPVTTTMHDLLIELMPESGQWPAARPDMDTVSAARLMAEHGMRRLPVLAADEVVGIVSITDLASELNELLQAVLLEESL